MIHPDAHSFWRRKQVTDIADAPKIRRCLNLLIDYEAAYLITRVALYVLFYTYLHTDWIDADLSGFLFGEEDMDVLLQRIVNVCAYFFIYFITESITKGHTLGKLITGTKAVQLDGSPITVTQAFIRSIARFIPFEVFAAIYTDPWHDTLSKTKVVRKNALLPQLSELS